MPLKKTLNILKKNTQTTKPEMLDQSFNPSTEIRLLPSLRQAWAIQWDLSLKKESNKNDTIITSDKNEKILTSYMSESNQLVNIKKTKGKNNARQHAWHRLINSNSGGWGRRMNLRLAWGTQGEPASKINQNKIQIFKKRRT